MNRHWLRSYQSLAKSHNCLNSIFKRQLSTVSSIKCHNIIYFQRCNAQHLIHMNHQRHFVQAIKKLFNPDNKELNDLEEQAYGCTENAQYTRALWGFEQLMNKQPDCARYYFDYGLTIIRYIDKPPPDMIEDA
eukprot:408777_1